MSDHDILSSHAIALKRELEQYIEEYQPNGGELALTMVTKLVMIVDKFPDEDRPL